MIEYDNIDFSDNTKSDSIVKVIGIGGGGSNAINYMYKQNHGDLNSRLDYIALNTDKQALNSSALNQKLTIGGELTEGLGAGNRPDIGSASAIESEEQIEAIVGDKTKIVFITAGMGGGTGTGAAPEVARIIKAKGILVVAIVTLPFYFEGTLRYNQAVEGIDKLKEHVDSLVVIHNENIRQRYGNLRVSEAFSMADDILAGATKGIAQIIHVSGAIHNVNVSDIEATIKDSGLAVIGTGKAAGENRAVEAVKEALRSPLIVNSKIQGAKNVLLNVSFSSAKEVTGNEREEIFKFINAKIDGKPDDIKWGDMLNENLEDELEVTLIATGFSATEELVKRSPADQVHVMEKPLEKPKETKKKLKQTPKPKPQVKVKKKGVLSSLSDGVTGFFQN